MQLRIFIVTFHGNSIIFCMVWRQNQNLSSICLVVVLLYLTHLNLVSNILAQLQSISQNFCQNIPNFVIKFASSLRSSKVHIEIQKPIC